MKAAILLLFLVIVSAGCHEEPAYAFDGALYCESPVEGVKKSYLYIETKSRSFAPQKPIIQVFFLEDGYRPQNMEILKLRIRGIPDGWDRMVMDLSNSGFENPTAMLEKLEVKKGDYRPCVVTYKKAVPRSIVNIYYSKDTNTIVVCSGTLGFVGRAGEMFTNLVLTKEK